MGQHALVPVAGHMHPFGCTTPTWTNQPPSRLIHAGARKGEEGWMKLLPQESEDMWHAYHLICTGDLVKAVTMRRMNKTMGGASVSERKRIELVLRVTKVDFDPEGLTLRVSGRVQQALGGGGGMSTVLSNSHHTLTLKLLVKFSVWKDCWDAIALERVRDACDAKRSAEVGAVVLNEGLAHVCLITSSLTLMRQRVESAIPRKRKYSVSQHDRGVLRFYGHVLDAILRHFDFNVVKVVLLGSPGFTRESFFRWMMEEAQRRSLKPLLSNRDRFVLVHTSSAHMSSVREALADPAVQTRLADTKAMREVQVLQAFYDTLRDEPTRAVYGFRHVQFANEHMAIERLLVTDELFRAASVSRRAQYVGLVEAVRDNGGKVLVFSSMHVTGRQLGQLTGVAAILRFPLPELDELDFSDDDDDDDDDDDEDDEDDEDGGAVGGGRGGYASDDDDEVRSPSLADTVGDGDDDDDDLSVATDDEDDEDDEREGDAVADFDLESLM